MQKEEEKRENHDKNNTNNYSIQIYNSRVHCKELLKDIIKNHTKDGFENFEDVSFFIKKKFNLKKFQYRRKEKVPKSIIDLTNYEKNQLADSNKKIKKKELETINSYMDDLLNQFKILEWVGVGFNNVESFKLNLSLKV